jgi:ATP-binding cassette subfamily C protein CydC
MRFWELQAGEILVGRQDIRLMDSYDLRSRIGVISQNTYLFAASLRDNLRLARPQATQQEIEQAARAAQLHDFIQTLPEGYDTWIGEQGLRLSAGERQRLAIARMLLKNASLLILDEPTANLDSLTERAILQELLALSAGQTTVLITHRLVYLDHFDEILVLRQGRVVERGAYNELLNQAGYFRQMWELQSQDLSDRV